MLAKEFLNQIPRIYTMIENKMREVEMLRNRATDVSIDMYESKIQATRNNHKMEMIIDSYTDMEQELLQDIQLLKERKKEVISVIEQLPIKEYDFLHKVYVQNIPLYNVAATSGFSYSWATTMHNRALKSVQNILDEKLME